jgi:hypothetical protein
MASIASAVSGNLIITGVVDGPRTGGTPKAIELYAVAAIPDLSIYNVETPNNGGAAVGMEFALSGSATAGQYLWISFETTEFSTYFGFGPTFTSGVANINGNDNVILYQNGVTIDQFGVNGQDGTGEAWEYTDGYAYRKDATGPDATFQIADWNFSGINSLDSQGASGINGTGGKTVPFGTYVAVPEASSFLFGGLLCSVLGLSVGARKFFARKAG